MAGDKSGARTNTWMFLLILFKSLKVRRNRVFITFFSIMIGAAIITALSSVYFDISTKMSRELRAYGANFFIGLKGSSGTRIADARMIEDALAMTPKDKLIGASPYLYGVVRLDLGNAVLVGVDFAALLLKVRDLALQLGERDGAHHLLCLEQRHVHLHVPGERERREGDRCAQPEQPREERAGLRDADEAGGIAHASNPAEGFSVPSILRMPKQS